MKSFPIALLALFAAPPAAAADRGYTLTDFDRVQVDGPYKVTLVTGSSTSASASGTPQALDRVSLEVQNRTLRIRRNRSAWGGYPGETVDGPIEIRLTTLALRSAGVSGSGGLTIDKAGGLKLELNVAGNGQLGVGQVRADTLSVVLDGSGRVLLGGHAKQMRATIRGSGDLDAAAFHADDVEIEAHTAGAISVGAVRSAKVRATGAGDVEIVGAPACSVQASGSGEVRCAN